MNAHKSVIDRELLVVLYLSSVSVSVPVSSSPSAVIARRQSSGNLQAVVRQSSGSHRRVVRQSSGSCGEVAGNMPILL